MSAFLRLIRLSFSPTLPSDLHYYLPALLLRVGANSWPLQGSELTSFLMVVLTGFDTVSFQSFGFEVYFDAVSTKCNVQAFALAACTVCDLNK